ncbi:MAG: xanthine dehydrogenase family protein molybdopterin-binding subunit, partial [Halobacteriales archaeon]|nr:xanthine dehydrogenase family protein molybdopterin-binding subunit [Halobacteriales archaeon]
MAKARVAGTERPRREDVPLVTGEAQYTDDFQPPETAYAAILRSQHAHAGIDSIDTEAAEALDGVVAVFTSDALDEAGTDGRFRISGSFPGQRATEFSILARDVVRYTGEPIAVAIADDRYRAHEALDLVEVAYERRDAVA